MGIKYYAIYGTNGYGCGVMSPWSKLVELKKYFHGICSFKKFDNFREAERYALDNFSELLKVSEWHGCIIPEHLFLNKAIFIGDLELRPQMEQPTMVIPIIPDENPIQEVENLRLIMKRQEESELPQNFKRIMRKI